MRPRGNDQDRRITAFLASLPPGASFDTLDVYQAMPKRTRTLHYVLYSLRVRHDITRTGKNTWMKITEKWLAFRVLRGRRVLVGQASRKKMALALFPGSQVERNPGYIDWTGRPEILAG